MNLLKLAVFTALTVSAALAQVLTPQGRLTLTSNTPVMTQDVVTTSTVYYTPYVGNTLPLPNGSGGYTNSTFSQLSWMSGSALSGLSVYDMFAYNNSGTWVLCVGPAWSNISASPWRGSGAGTTEITQVAGIWVNANAISTCRNNIGGNNFTYSVAANAGVYLGSVYLDNSLTVTMQFKPTPASGGTVNQLALYNAYNRVQVFSQETDAASSWTYASTTWGPLNGASSNTANRVSWLDGLQQSGVAATYGIFLITGGAGQIGVSLDSTSTAPNIFPTIGGGTSVGVSIAGQETFTPQRGWHYLQSMQSSTGGTTTYYADGDQFLAVTLQM